MGRIRRGGYIIKWFIGDHSPRHVHVEKEDGKLLGRFSLETMCEIGGWKADRKLLKIVAELVAQKRL